MKRTALFAMAVICAVMPSFADTTLTWNGADGASWTTGENWLDGITPTNWVDGASAVFSGAAWASGATLAITGTGSLPTQSLRFGTGKGGLTNAQLKQITYNGERVSLDSSGYLCHRGGLVLIVR